MIEKDFTLNQSSKAVLVSLVSSKFEGHSTREESERSLVELKELMRTLNIVVLNSYTQKREQIEPATILGKGRLLEIGEEAKKQGGDLLVFDFELTAGQVRNIKKITGLDVIDRCQVILEIFATHARTREAKIQVEISKLQYLLPRLTGLWGHFSRQKGGVGVMGGEGEQQIELDRRIIRQRIEFFKKELEDLVISRKEQRKKRSKQAVIAALVGYTNAGKSSLMNRLCRQHVLEENKLFATLDSTFRMLNPDTRPPMLLIDTVGFISNLPNTLIEGFKTTLESALEADLLIVVCDISDPHYKNHLEVTENVLKELGLEKKERFIVFNKNDLLNDELKVKIIKKQYPDSFVVSSFNEKDIDELRQYITEYFLNKQDHYDLFIPYEMGEAHSKIMAKANIMNKSSLERGIFYRIRIPNFIFASLGMKQFILAPEDEIWQEIQKSPLRK